MIFELGKETLDKGEGKGKNRWMDYSEMSRIQSWRMEGVKGKQLYTWPILHLFPYAIRCTSYESLNSLIGHIIHLR